MELVIVSDTHGDRAILESIQQQHPHADAYLYAGDSELAASDSIFETYQAVQGNMDFDAFPMTRTIEVAGITVFMTHGHRFGVNFDLTQLIAAGQEVGAQLIVFGHTHQLGVERHDNMVVLNPGSISQPRGQFADIGGTYAVVTGDRHALNVQYLNRQSQVQPGLSRTFTLA